MHTLVCIFFSRVHTAGTLSGGWRWAKNRPKTRKKTPIARKGVCISVTILTCFADVRTSTLVAMGRPISVFIAHAKDCLLKSRDHGPTWHGTCILSKDIETNAKPQENDHLRGTECTITKHV